MWQIGGYRFERSEPGDVRRPGVPRQSRRPSFGHAAFFGPPVHSRRRKVHDVRNACFRDAFNGLARALDVDAQHLVATCIVPDERRRVNEHVRPAGHLHERRRVVEVPGNDAYAETFEAPRIQTRWITYEAGHFMASFTRELAQTTSNTARHTRGGDFHSPSVP